MMEPESSSRLRGKMTAATEWLPRLVARVPATVHAKLLVGFLVIVALLIALGAVGLQVLSRVNRQAEDLVKRQQRIAAYRQFQRDTSLPPSWSWNEGTLETALLRLNEFRYDLDQLQFVSMDDSEPLARLRENYDEFIDVVGQLVELTRAGNVAGARDLHLTKAGPLAARLERLTNDLVNRAEVDLLAGIDASQAAYMTSRWVVIGFAVGTIGLALVLGYAISWSLIGPVRLMDSRLRRVASGDLSQRVEVANRDELGDLAVQFNRMAAQLQESDAKREERTRQLTEALEQQTATAEILRVISNSPTQLQPVLEAIAESAARLCDAWNGTIVLSDGEALRMEAHHGPLREQVGVKLPIDRGSVSGRAFLEGQTIHVEDLSTAADFTLGRELAIRWGVRSILGTPLLRENVPIGVILIRRTEIRPFSEKQIALLKTFADQAVIAIENVRLFTELQEKNRALTEAHAQVTEALERQTATSEILGVISSSLTDVQPVFDIIGERAEKLCEAEVSVVSIFDGTLIQLAALHVAPEGTGAVRRYFPMQLGAETVTARMVRSRAVVHIEDVLADPEYEAKDAALVGPWRGALGVPMIREGQVVGAIFVARTTAGYFSDVQVQLLKTFADQAVIAIENVRLFKELEARTAELTRSVEELKALGEVSRAVSSTLDLQTVLDTIVTRASQLSGTHGGVIYEYDDATDKFHLRAAHRLEDELVEALRLQPLRLGEGATGQAAATRAPFQVTNLLDEKEYTLTRVRDILARLGYRSILAVPLIFEQRILGALVVHRPETGAFAPEVVNLLQTFAVQSALAIQNARLFREIEDKSRQLEAASRHKSEFLANMSHELRTPLNAITGFSEVLLERMFGEINPKQTEYLQDILSSGRHLLSLINDILDLSKIEAGRMELTLAQFHLPLALDNAITLVKERAARHGIALDIDIDPRLGEFMGDERKIKQVLLNLLSNAVKFTPEGGRIGVKAMRSDGTVEIAVSDTGIGIAPKDQEAIFEEFRQVGSDEARKVEGTGLGLTLTKKFIEMHGGRIWVESGVGKGSTFRFTLPVK
jgi:signal transduction histidine kinase/putative methionine-R-sulfoxide reductase with GAF domain/CHASE3 domain sensor protein